MADFTLHITDVKKVFNRRVIFEGIRDCLRKTEALAVTGRNGSGKSTLAKIIAGVLSPSAGSVVYEYRGVRLKQENLFRHVGFVAPYLQLYDEFSGYENLVVFARLRALKPTSEMYDRLLELVNLLSCKNDLVRTYSSGMKQRLKYAFALLHRPPLLVLDEPMANLDAEGVSMVHEVMQQHRQDGILVAATNDSNDVKYCDRVLNLDDRSSFASANVRR